MALTSNGPSMQRLDLLVRMAREQTGNATYSLTQGVKQREFVRYANEAQTRLYNLMVEEHSALFLKEAFMDSVQGQEAYNFPADVNLRGNVLKIDYSFSGQAINYVPLVQRTPRQQVSVPGYSDGYISRAGQFIVNPIPMQSVSNAFRLNYVGTIPAVDIRRALVSSVGLAGSVLSTITFTNNAALLPETEDELTNGWVDYVTLVDASGNLQAQNIQVVSYDSVGKVLTVSKTLAAGETAQAGYYTCFGPTTTTHPQLPQICERYLVWAMSLFAQMRDSNSESALSSPVLTAIEKDILDSIAALSEDLTSIPILDATMLSYSDDM